VRSDLASASAKSKPKLAVVSPFIDKQHGTERRVAEWISGLADDFEIHVYSQQVEDVDLSKIVWHRVPKVFGPHLLNYSWWFLANRVRRGWDRRFHGVRPDLVFSPGINCLDADVVSVHVIFTEYLKRRPRITSPLPVSSWLRIIHHGLYYRLIAFLESRVYRDPESVLFLISQKTALELEQHFGRLGPFPVIYLGLDLDTFNPLRRDSLRRGARAELGYSDNRFVVLLIGNDWKNKGLLTLVDAVALLPELPIDVLAVGRENAAEYQIYIRSKSTGPRVAFKPPRKDVDYYYAAADAYVGASIEDTFAQPPAEAMACGLPVIVSSTNGTSEIITNGLDGLILKSPTDVRSLSGMLRELYENVQFRERLGSNAAETARQYTWERNARELRLILDQALRRKSGMATHTVAQES